MNYHRLSILVLMLCISASPLRAVCNLGSFSEIVDSPFGAGNSPFGVAYSPLTAGNLFAAVVNAGGGTISTYSVDTTTGAFTSVGTPSAGTVPLVIAYSPLFNNNLFAAINNNSDNTVSVFQVNTGSGVFTPVPGSPFATGPVPESVAYSPLTGSTLFAAVVNGGDNTVSVYQTNAITGALTPITGSPFATGNRPTSIAYSPQVSNTGALFAAVANLLDDTVSVYSVTPTTGFFTAADTKSTGSQPNDVAFSPVVSGNLFLAVSNGGDNTVSVYSVNTITGVLTSIPGSPFNTGTDPVGVAYSPVISGNLFAAVSNNGDNTVSVYQVDTSTGAFTPVTGSPFATGDSPVLIDFSPIVTGGLFAAVANNDDNTVSVYNVTSLLPVITTQSMTVTCNTPFTINGIIEGGTPPYSLIWSDAFPQTSPTASFSRTVTVGTTTTTFQINTATDANGCVGGPSNMLTLNVICCTI